MRLDNYLINKNYFQTRNKAQQAIKTNRIKVNDKVITKNGYEISELDKSTISRQMNLLVKEGLVTRETGQDKRYSFFELSEKAKDIYKNYTHDFVKYVEDALIGWSEEEKQMFSVLIGRANYSLSPSISNKE